MLSVTGIQVESGAREETGRFKDVKTCVATGDRTGSQELASCSITTTQPQHDTTGQRHRAFDVFIVPVTLSSSPSRSSPQTILCYECHGNLCGVRKLREETGRFRDVKDGSRPGIEPGSQVLASCTITAGHRSTISPALATELLMCFRVPVTLSLDSDCEYPPMAANWSADHDDTNVGRKLTRNKEV